MEIYLDMDGVISDFTAGVCKLLNIKFDPIRYSETFLTGLWDYTEWIKDKFGVEWAYIAEKCSTEHFWSHLPLIPDAYRLHNLLALKYKITFLTTPTGDYLKCLYGKKEWLQINNFTSFNSERTNHIILMQNGKSKAVYAQPDTVLIDDNDKNVQEFIKGGGKAILVPRPWNNRHFEFRTYKQANDLVLENLETLV